MDIRYFDKWFRAKKTGIGPLPEQEAQRRHNAREAYIALVSDYGTDRYVVDVAAPWISVLFLDDRGRIQLNYDFNECDPGRLFLKSAIHRVYEGESERLAHSVSFSFQLDGRILIERVDHQGSVTEEKEATADLDPNWEAYPRFGDYRNLCRIERSSPPTQ